jgi:DNA helicase HerA-like ATPase
MWLLADLFHDLPEVGDTDVPKLVFFFDEAHLLFADASKAFLDAIAQTVRLIRSKGVGVFFVTQSPTDVPDDVLAQLGSRIQHQLRAHTPNDAKALKQTVNTYPTSAYPDLGEVLTSLGIGEAIVTVMNEKGAPTPVAWTRLRAPESLMAAAEPSAMGAAVTASPLHAKYATAIDRDSAYERLTAKVEAGAAKADAEQQQQANQQTGPSRPSTPAKPPARRRTNDKSVVEEVVGSTAFRQVMRTAAREIIRGVFKTGRR